MRLTILNQFYRPDLSPTAHLSASLASHRAAAGDVVTVVTSRGGYVPASADAAEAERHANPRVHRIWTPRLGKAAVWKRCVDYLSFYLGAAWRLIRLPAQDVIVSLTTPPFIAWAAVLHKMLHPRTKLVLWNMDCYPELAERSGALKENGPAARAMRFFNRALFRRLDRLVCLDEAMRHLLTSQYATGGREPRAVIIPNWEDLSFFPPDAPASEPLDDPELAGKFVVLYLGNAGWGHQFETVVEAAEATRGEPVVFLFVGGGARWNYLRDQKERRRLDNLLLRDYVPKELTRRVMASAGCALITLRDPILGVMSPSKLHSNLAMGLPILYVGPETSNVDEAVKQFGCGASLRHGDVAGVTAFLRRLMNDADARAALGRKARAAFDEAYCDVRTLPQFDSLLTGLADPPREELNHEATKGTKRSSDSPAPVRKDAMELVPSSKT
jgi:glycosyltransferase involved in cell wall biosynthesis